METYGWLLALLPVFAGLASWYLQTSMVLDQEEDGPPRVTFPWVTPVLAFQSTALLVYVLLTRWMISGAPPGADLSEFRLFFLLGTAGGLGRYVVNEPRFPIPPAATLPTARRVMLQVLAGTPWWFLLSPQPVGLAGLAVIPRWLGVQSPPTRIEEFFGVCTLFAGLQWVLTYAERRWRAWKEARRKNGVILR